MAIIASNKLRRAYLLVSQTGERHGRLKKREKKIAKKLANKKRWGNYVKDDDNADATTPPVVNEPAKTETPHIRVNIDRETHVIGTIALLRGFYTDANLAFMLTKSASLMSSRREWDIALEAADMYDRATDQREIYENLVKEAEENLEKMREKVTSGSQKVEEAYAQFKASKRK